MKKWKLLSIFGLVSVSVVVAGGAAASVLTIDVDAELANLAELHEVLADVVDKCPSAEQCLMTYEKLEPSFVRSYGNLDLAMLFGRNQKALPRLRDEVARGVAVACVASDSSELHASEAEPAWNEMCTRYKKTVRR